MPVPLSQLGKIERAVSLWFEANGFNVENRDGEWIVADQETCDSFSLTALALAIEEVL
jgi:hypothetical protein